MQRVSPAMIAPSDVAGGVFIGPDGLSLVVAQPRQLRQTPEALVVNIRIRGIQSPCAARLFAPVYFLIPANAA